MLHTVRFQMPAPEGEAAGHVSAYYDDATDVVYLPGELSDDTNHPMLAGMTGVKPLWEGRTRMFVPTEWLVMFYPNMRTACEAIAARVRETVRGTDTHG